MAGETKRLFSVESLSTSEGPKVEPWHSTPVKKNTLPPVETPDVSFSETRTKPGLHDLISSSSSSSARQYFQEPGNQEHVMVHNQRLELQFLLAELQSCEQEFSTMSETQRKLLLFLEQKRERMRFLEQRCARLKDGLSMGQTVGVEEELSRSKHGLDVNLPSDFISQNKKELYCQDKTQSLKRIIKTLSTQAGRMHAREEELQAMLKLKDNDLIEATNHILELSGRLCELEKSFKDSQDHKEQMRRELDQHKKNSRGSRHEYSKLKAEFQEQTVENNNQRERIISLRQEKQLLAKELSEVQNRWTNLLNLYQSKLAKAESTIRFLQKVCHKNRSHINLLNAEKARETHLHHNAQRAGYQDRVLMSRGCQSRCSDASTVSQLLPDEEICISEPSHSNIARFTANRRRSDVGKSDSAEARSCDVVGEDSRHITIPADVSEAKTPGKGSPDSLIRCKHPSVADRHPSAWSRPGRSDSSDSALCTEFSSSEDCGSSTSRLQRLLAESLEMLSDSERSCINANGPDWSLSDSHLSAVKRKL